MIYLRSLTSTLFTFTLLTLSISFLLSWPLATSFAQLSSSPQMPLTQEGANQLAELEAARQQYLSAWNNTPFTPRFDVFVAEGTHLGYGIYREHVPANIFRPGETIVLYVEPVGFGHQPVTDASSTQDGGNNTTAATGRTLYLVNMTADYILSDSSGTELVTIEDLPAANIASHRQNTEFSLTLTLSQEEPFPVGDYIVTYIVHDQVTAQSFQIDKSITIDEDASTGALPLPDSNEDNNSMQQLIPQEQPEQRRSQALEP